MNSFVSMKSNPPPHSIHPQPRPRPALDPSGDLKRCMSDYVNPTEVTVAVERSRRAMEGLEDLSKKINSYRQLYLAVKGVQERKK